MEALACAVAVAVGAEYALGITKTPGGIIPSGVFCDKEKTGGLIDCPFFLFGFTLNRCVTVPGKRLPRCAPPRDIGLR